VERRALLRRRRPARPRRRRLRVWLDRLARQYALDPRRVFATGISNGGLFSYVLACRLSGRIAAAAPVAATLDSDCSPRRPVSILHVHGLDDENIPYDGGDGPRGVTDVVWPPVEVGIGRWQALDGCPAEAKTTVGGAITIREWSPCRGHCYPPRHARWRRPHLAKGAAVRCDA
jgi:polyhydroxybutyrate depolymerase